MSRRIGDRELGGAPLALTERPRMLTRASNALGSPVGVLVVVPGLVLLVGLLLTWIGQAALMSGSLALGREQLASSNAIVSRQLGLVLAQSDTILERLASLAEGHSPAARFEPIAFAMRDLIAGRAGVAYVSISFPDGTFQGAYPDTDGRIRFQDSRVEADGTRVRRFETEGRTKLEPFFEERSTYDPRTRDFYRLALESAGAAWTEPYPFYKTHYTGVTRARALRRADGAVHAVLTVDFDVNELSHYLERIPLAGSRVVLFSADGTLLADPAAAERIRALPLSNERALRVSDLKDPVLDTFFARASSAPGSERFDAAGRAYLGHRASVGDAALGWYLGSFVPEEVLLAPSRAHKRRSGLLAFGSLVLAGLVALSFSRHVVRMRRQTAEATAAAKRAAAEVKALGSYRLTKRLGVGGMGEVWLAEHQLLAREAAIKLIHGAAAPTAEAQERFRREAQTISSLRSRNTIELFDYGVADDGTLFFVMELLDGMDLETLVQRFGPQPPGRVCSFLMQACSSLAEAHASGLIHRDIKPANLYACRAADEVDVLKVLDFGLVRSLSDASPVSGRSLEDLARELESSAGSSGELARLTAAGSVMGTPDFMAPEQILGLETDARADIYALGCVAFFVLTAELPFPGHTQPMASMMAHLQAEPDAMLKRCRQHRLPEALAGLIVRCMAKRTEDRLPSMSLLRGELALLTFPESDAWTAQHAGDWWDENVPRRPVQRGSSIASLGPAASG